MVIFMAALLDVPARAVRGGRSSTARAPSAASATSRCPRLRPILGFAAITGVIATMQYYTEPLVAGQVASGQIGGSGQQVEPGYPAGSTLTLPAAGLQPRLPALRHRRRLRRRGRALRAVDGLRRAPDASGQRVPGGRRMTTDDRARPRSTPPRPRLAPTRRPGARPLLEWVALHVFADHGRAALRAAVRVRRPDRADERPAVADPRAVAAPLRVAQPGRRVAHARVRDLVAQHAHLRRGGHGADPASPASRSPTPWPASGSAVATWR